MPDINRIRAQGVADAAGRAITVLDFTSYLIGRRGVITRLIGSLVIQPGATLLQDAFTRVVGAGSWGTPDVGPAWNTLQTMAGNNINVNGTQGVFGNAVGGGPGYDTVTADLNLADLDITFTIGTGTVGAANGRQRALLRVKDVNNYYAFDVDGATPHNLRIIKKVAGVESQIGLGATKTAAIPFFVRASILGSHLGGKIWTGVEPTANDLENTDVAITGSGDAGCSLNALDAGGYDIRFDDLTIVTSGGAPLGTWTAFIGDISNPLNLIDSSQGLSLSSWVPSLVNGQPIFQGDQLSVVTEGLPDGTKVVVSAYLTSEPI